MEKRRLNCLPGLVNSQINKYKGLCIQAIVHAANCIPSYMPQRVRMLAAAQHTSISFLLLDSLYFTSKSNADIRGDILDTYKLN